MRESYERSRPYVEAYVRSIKTSSPIEPRHISDHVCDHDHHAHIEIPEPPPKYDNHRLHASATNITTHPFKIMLNTTYLFANETRQPQTCYNVNDIVVLGAPGAQSQGPCDKFSMPCSYTCNTTDIVTPELSILIAEHVLPFIVDTLQHYLLVDSTGVTKLPYRNDCQRGIQVPLVYESTGFQGDFGLYITATPIIGNVVANAVACIFDNINDNRPLLGVINLNPRYYAEFLSSSFSYEDWQTFLHVGLHESIHALGFNSGLYKYYIDRTTGKPWGDASYVITSSVYSSQSPSGVAYNRTRSYIKTPAVLAIAREHFNCSTLEGAEIENIGGSGTVGSHWKATTFGEELMLGYSQPIAPLSNLTLAILYDSGWYEIANSVDAEPLVWGRDQGCPFAAECTPTSWAAKGYFGKNLEKGCSATRGGVGIIVYINYTQPLPVEQQHWTNSSTGSYFPYKDYCPFSEVYSSSLPAFSQYYCFDRNVAPKNSVFEVISDTSKCFEYVDSGNPFSSYEYPGACWEQSCVNGVLNVIVNTTAYPCAYGTNVIIGNLTIICPNDVASCQPLSFPVDPSIPTVTLPPATPGPTPNFTGASTGPPITTTTGFNSSPILSASFTIITMATLIIASLLF
eukprot:gene12289-14406_t